MNLYLRLLLTIVKALRAPRVRLGESVEFDLRVWPTDLDLNGHMNNGRYLTMVDLALATIFIRSGFARLCFSRGWRPMGAWDDFWSYARFDFVREGELCATGFVKGAAAGRGGLVRNSEIYPALGYHDPSPAFPEDLLAWLATDRLLHSRAKAA